MKQMLSTINNWIEKENVSTRSDLDISTIDYDLSGRQN